MSPQFRALVIMKDQMQAVLLLLIGICLGVFLSAMFPNELHAPFAGMSDEPRGR